MTSADEPIFMAVDSGCDGFQKTIVAAQESLAVFKAGLKDMPEGTFACVKFFIPESPESEGGAYFWLMNPFFEDGYCFAQPFELPPGYEWIQVGQWLKFHEQDLLDWYLLSASGQLKGGYSLRYQRELIPPEKRQAFDERIGVTKYL